MPKRPALPGDLCTCGRPAVTVFEFDDRPPLGYCGLPDGGRQSGPCPFCDAPERHRTAGGEPVKCPHYRLRPTDGGNQ